MNNAPKSFLSTAAYAQWEETPFELASLFHAPVFLQDIYEYNGVPTYKIHKTILENADTYRKVASSNTSCLEAHDGLFRLLMKGIFDPYVL